MERLKPSGERKDRGRWRRRAVSPVIGEILMVSITIVLVGVLAYYVQLNQSQSGRIEVPLGTTVEKLPTGNWTITVARGSATAFDATILVKNPDTGAATVSSPILSQSWYFVFNDNNGDSDLDAGDIILLNQTAGIVESGFHLEIVKTAGTLSGPLELP